MSFKKHNNIYDLMYKLIDVLHDSDLCSRYMQDIKCFLKDYIVPDYMKYKAYEVSVKSIEDDRYDDSCLTLIPYMYLLHNEYYHKVTCKLYEGYILEYKNKLYRLSWIGNQPHALVSEFRNGCLFIIDRDEFCFYIIESGNSFKYATNLYLWTVPEDIDIDIPISVFKRRCLL